VQTGKAARKATPKHIKMNELPEAERFNQLSTPSKHLVDTLKMIAYRAETAMANLWREHRSHPDEARSLLQALYRTEAAISCPTPTRAPSRCVGIIWRTPAPTWRSRNSAMS